MTRYAAAAMLFSAVFITSPAAAATWTATSATIANIFKTVADGDTIVMTGSFGSVKMQNRIFATGVTIDATSADFSDSLVITKVDGLNIVGGRYGSADVPTTQNRAIVVSDASNINILTPIVTGAFIGTGIGFSRSTNVSVSDGSFTRVKTGVFMDRVTGGRMVRNTLFAGVSDGFNVSNSRNVVVSDNSCTGTTPLVGYHPDCVQMWTSPGEIPQSDITITNNFASGATQGFTGFDSSGIGYDRVVITNNTIAGLYPQGIACYNCRDSLVSGNVATALPGAQWRVSVNVIGGSNNVVTNNSVGAVDKSLATPLTYYSVVQTAAGPQLAIGGLVVSDVPEPAAWQMLLTGFGLIGGAIRYRNQRLAHG